MNQLVLDILRRKQVVKEYVYEYLDKNRCSCGRMNGNLRKVTLWIWYIFRNVKNV